MNERGETLIAALIASAIGTVVLSAILAVISQMHLAQNNVKFRADADALNEEIRALLSSAEACTNSFSTRDAVVGANHTIYWLRDGSPSPGAIVKTVGQINGDDAHPGDSTVRLTSMNLLDLQTTPDGKKTMSLLSTFSSVKSSTGAQNVPRQIKISVDVDMANRITRCVALAKMSDGIWRRSPLNSDNIFFMAPAPGGNVGIGTPTPQSALEVVGTIRAGAATSGGPCTVQGAMAYDYDTAVNKPIFCDGTIWKVLGAPDRSWHSMGLPAGTMSGGFFTSTCNSSTQNTTGAEMDLVLIAYSAGGGTASAAFMVGPSCSSLQYVGGDSFGIFSYQSVLAAEATVPSNWYWQVKARYSGSVALPLLMGLY
ncbi:MAG: hypothetical protein AB7G93_19245 [Bdellovibrionales bacterium]